MRAHRRHCRNVAALALFRVAVAACIALACPASRAGADEPAPAQREVIEGFFRSSLPRPDATQWQYVSAREYGDGGVLWCGKVNVMNSAKQYVGFRPFYATLFADGVHQGTILGGIKDDPVGSIGDKLTRLCGF